MWRVVVSFLAGFLVAAALVGAGTVDDVRRAATADAIAEYHSGLIDDAGLAARLTSAGHTIDGARAIVQLQRLRPSYLHRWDDPKSGEMFWRHAVRDGSGIERMIQYRCTLVKASRPPAPTPRP